METDLIPNIELISPGVLTFMRLVFKVISADRCSAQELLSHPLVQNGEKLKQALNFLSH